MIFISGLPLFFPSNPFTRRYTQDTTKRNCEKKSSPALAISPNGFLTISSYAPCMKGNPTFSRGAGRKKTKVPRSNRREIAGLSRNRPVPLVHRQSVLDNERELSRRWWRMGKVIERREENGVVGLVCGYLISYSLCSDDAGISSAGTCVFCRRRSGMPPPFFGAKLGHNAGCTMLMQSVCAFALQPRHRTPWRLWPRSTWPHASHGVILRYVYSRQVCPPSDSRLFLRKQSPLFTGTSRKSTCACSPLRSC